MGQYRVTTGEGVGLSLWDASQDTLGPLTIPSPSLQRQQALAPPLSCRPPPPRSATRGLWWAVGPWQCVGQLDWSWLPMVSSLFSEYLPNQGRKRGDVGAGRGQGYGDLRGSSMVGKGVVQPGCGQRALRTSHLGFSCIFLSMHQICLLFQIECSGGDLKNGFSNIFLQRSQSLMPHSQQSSPFPLLVFKRQRNHVEV